MYKCSRRYFFLFYISPGKLPPTYSIQSNEDTGWIISNGILIYLLEQFGVGD
jgi:hypothetical protein